MSATRNRASTGQGLERKTPTGTVYAIRFRVRERLYVRLPDARSRGEAEQRLVDTAGRLRAIEREPAPMEHRPAARACAFARIDARGY
jgi:hypothetical protein